MNELKNSKDASSEESRLSRLIGKRARLMLKARRGGTKSVWFGLGMSGLIGWSVAVPTLVGVALGIWIDQRHPSQYSWTLMLLLSGLILGCFNAWHWVDAEYRVMQEGSDE